MADYFDELEKKYLYFITENRTRTRLLSQLIAKSRRLLKLADLVITGDSLTDVRNVFQNMDIIIKHAVKANNFKCTQLLLEIGYDINTKRFCCKRSLIHFVRSVEMLQLLVSYSADVNSQNQYGNSILHLTEDITLIKGLLSVPGINLHLANNCGYIPLDLAESDKKIHLLSKHML